MIQLHSVLILINFSQSDIITYSPTCKSKQNPIWAFNSICTFDFTVEEFTKNHTKEEEQYGFPFNQNLIIGNVKPILSFLRTSYVYVYIIVQQCRHTFTYTDLSFNKRLVALIDSELETIHIAIKLKYLRREKTRKNLYSVFFVCFFMFVFISQYSFFLFRLLRRKRKGQRFVFLLLYKFSFAEEARNCMMNRRKWFTLYDFETKCRGKDFHSVLLVVFTSDDIFLFKVNSRMDRASRQQETAAVAIIQYVTSDIRNAYTHSCSSCSNTIVHNLVKTLAHAHANMILWQWHRKS